MTEIEDLFNDVKPSLSNDVKGKVIITSTPAGINNFKELFEQNTVTFKDKYDYLYEFNETAELKELVYQKVLNWFKEHNSFHSETIMQNDDTLIDAPELLSDICDNFNFKCLD